MCAYTYAGYVFQVGTAGHKTETNFYSIDSGTRIGSGNRISGAFSNLKYVTGVYGCPQSEQTVHRVYIHVPVVDPAITAIKMCVRLQ